MKNQPTPEQLFNTAKKTPTEMDYARIDAIVREFPAGGNAANTIINPKLITLAALLATAALMLALMNRPKNDPPELATVVVVGSETKEIAPPAREETVVVTPAPPEETAATPAALAPVNLPPVGAGAKRQTGDIAPAAAPKKPAPAARKTVIPRQKDTPINSAPLPSFGETTITGDFALTDKGLLLETVERVNGRKITWMLPTALGETEQLVLFQPDASTGYLERETGRLILMKDNNRQGKGTFSFQPRIETLKRYEKAGMGTSDVPAEAIRLNGMQQGVSFAPEVFTEQPAEILWLKYFTLGIDREYLDLLREMGYGEEAVQGIPSHGNGGLWQIANHGLTSAELTSLHRTLEVLYGKAGEAFSFAELTELYQNRILLSALVKEGYQSLGANQIRSLLSSDVGPAYLREMNEVFDRRLIPEELLALREADLFATGIRRLQRDGYNDLSVAAYIRLHTEPQIAKEAPEEVQLLTVDDNFGRKRKNWRSGKLKLSPFDKLVVEDDIRLVIIPGDTDQAEIVKVNMKGVDVALNVSSNGTLTIRKKTKFGWKVDGFVIAEIRLTASQLKNIEVKAPARVFVAGDPAIYTVEGKVGRAVVE